MSPDTQTPPGASDLHSTAAVKIQALLREAHAEFEQLMNELKVRLERFVFSQAGGMGRHLTRDDVVDVLSEAWSTVWVAFNSRESGFRYNGEKSFPGWVSGIALNYLKKFAFPRKAVRLSDVPGGDQMPDRSQPPPELVMRLSQGWGDFCWLRDSLPLLDTHLTRLLAMHPDAGAERTRGPRGSRTYTGLLGLQESVQRVLALQEFCTNGGGATEPPEIDDE